MDLLIRLRHRCRKGIRTHCDCDMLFLPGCCEVRPTALLLIKHFSFRCVHSSLLPHGAGCSFRPAALAIAIAHGCCCCCVRDCACAVVQLGRLLLLLRLRSRIPDPCILSSCPCWLAFIPVNCLPKCIVHHRQNSFLLSPLFCCAL